MSDDFWNILRRCMYLRLCVTTDIAYYIEMNETMPMLDDTIDNRTPSSKLKQEAWNSLDAARYCSQLYCPLGQHLLNGGEYHICDCADNLLGTAARTISNVDHFCATQA